MQVNEKLIFYLYKYRNSDYNIVALKNKVSEDTNDKIH